MGWMARVLLAGIAGVSVCGTAVHAQDVVPGARSYFGVTLGRAYAEANCPATALYCESRDRSAQLFAGRMFDRHWGAELGYMDTGRLAGPTGDTRAQALRVSLVGRAQVLPAMEVFGKVGTAYGRPDTNVMGNSAAAGPDAGLGLAWGGGISYDITKRLSATLEVGSYDLRLGSGPVRSGTLGLQYRY
jgi:OmpA-OmpF porin, OOP family